MMDASRPDLNLIEYLQHRIDIIKEIMSSTEPFSDEWHYLNGKRDGLIECLVDLNRALLNVLNAESKVE